MSYIDGFVIPVPTDNRAKVIDHARRMDTIFLELTDPRMMAEPMPFDGKRMIFGGFEPVIDLKA
ncbi:hypothetical protein BH09PSE3_BH09PSE3_21050 [soil metagenome]